MKQVVFYLVYFYSHLFIIKSVLFKLLVVLLNILLLFGDSSLIPLSVLLELNTGLCELPPNLIDILGLHRKVAHGLVGLRAALKLCLGLLYLVLDLDLEADEFLALMLYELLVGVKLELDVGGFLVEEVDAVAIEVVYAALYLLEVVKL